jgi:hypothetical protein
MWTIDKNKISDGRLTFEFAFDDELPELWATLRLLLGKTGSSEYQAELLKFGEKDKPMNFRGDTVFIDADNPNVFVLRLWRKRGEKWLKIEYRMSRNEAEDLAATWDCIVED